MALQSKVQVELPLFTRMGRSKGDLIELGTVTVEVPVTLKAEAVELDCTAVTAALLESFRKEMG